ncbi:MAG: hypothetical protein ACE5JS_14700 [Nitrospinota bacterium]
MVRLLPIIGSCVILFSLVISPHAKGIEIEDDWFVAIIGGIGTDETLEELGTFDVDFRSSYFAALSLARALASYDKYLTLEAEGQVVKHFKEQDHFEFNGLLILRWNPFFWDRYLDTSFAVGDGLSYATEIPTIEAERNHETSRLLNYFMIEVAASVPNAPRWGVFGRIHHRSGVFGLYNGARGGSNFLAAGIRFRF